MRSFLAREARLDSASSVVDLCTGTGESALRMAEENRDARIIGVDFSEGMLRRARKKSPRGAHLLWIQADVSRLPVSSGSVDRVTCTYAMYELSGPVREQTLKEAFRILRPEGMFVMMEHLPPDRAFLKLLYLLRIHLLGSRSVRTFAGAEEKDLALLFAEVRTTVAPGGKTKAVHGVKPRTFLGSKKVSAG
jgi:ubiquinone/menaquinone biosynthesis C-methylase UbiE